MFNIKTSNNINEIISNIDGKEQKVKLAAIKALNRTALWLKAKAAKEISEEKKIKLSLIRKRLRIFKAKTSRLDVLIRANLYDIRASTIGKIQKIRRGSKVGKYQFIGGFAAVMPKGNSGIFKREGTPASLKIALKWANIEDITIIEEPPGKHFFELQVGIRDVPNDFFVDAVVELAKLSLPARSRLMRLFNDHYNIGRFILDESFFGSLLSDYSGTKIEKDGPVLSFGRVNFFRSNGPVIRIIENYLRDHYERALSNDIYRLDVAILGETEPHTKNYNGIYERNHVWYNFKALYPLPQSLLPAIKFAKAQIVLSDSWNLGEINACFPVTSIEEEGDKFLLGSSKLSEQLWNLKYQPILERFFAVYHYQVKNFSTPKIIRFSVTEHYIHFESDLNSEQKDSIHELENYILVFYQGVLTWHEHRHLNRSWEEKQVICLIS